MFCIGLNKFRCPSPQRNRTKFPGRSDREASLSPDDPHSSKTADSRRRERAGIHSSPADHAPPKPDRAFRPFRPRHRCPDRPCADEACRPPSPVWFDLSPMRRASAFAPHGFAGPAARSREKTGSLPPNDRIVPSTGMRPSTGTSSFRPSLRTGLDFGKASRHNIESFPYEPDGKSIRCPENRCALHANAPPKTERGTDRPSVSRRTTFFVAASSPAQPPSGIHIYRTAFGQAGTKNLRRRTKPAQEHAPYPPTDGIPKQCSEKPKHAATKSKKGCRTKKACESQHTEPRFPKRIFASCRSRSSRVKREFRIRPPPVRNAATAHRTERGSRLSAAPLSAALRHPSPPVFTRARPRSPAFACSPALSPEKRNDAGSEVGNDAPHGRKTSVTLLPAPHSPSTFFPHSVPGFPVLTAALARMPTRQVYTPMDRGLCLPSSSPTAGSPGSKPCKHPDRRPPPRRGIETVISESAARRVFRRHVRTCRRNRPRPGPKPSPGNGPPRKMRK